MEGSRRQKRKREREAEEGGRKCSLSSSRMITVVLLSATPSLGSPGRTSTMLRINVSSSSRAISSSRTVSLVKHIMEDSAGMVTVIEVAL